MSPPERSAGPTRAAAPNKLSTRFAAEDGATQHESLHYDLICTFDALHDQAQPAQVPSNITCVLFRDACFTVVEAHQPEHAGMNTCYGAWKRATA